MLDSREGREPELCRLRWEAGIMASMNAGPSETPVDVLRRWEQFGGIWTVTARSPSGLTVALMTCDGREEVQRLTSTDPDLVAFVGDRVTSAP